MLEEHKILNAFPLGAIIPTDPYSVNALEKEVAYLKSFDIDRVLSAFRQNAGIKTDAEPYGGWEELLIGGHAMGHYFTALAQATVNNGIPEVDRAVLGKMLDEIIAELAKCQLPDGFLWGGKVICPENVEFQFDNVEQGKTQIFDEAWVPWYTMHKVLEGLIAAYEIAGNEQALEVAKKLGDWVCSRTDSWDENTHATVLATEYGGMNDIMYELYRATGEDKYAVAAHAFDEEPLFDDILTNRHNLLTGRHANTTIPKIMGALRRYQITHGRTVNGEKVDAARYLEVTKVFWDNVMLHHTYHTGGNSEWEHFRGDDTLDKERTNANCETCNVYNMLKLTKELFKLTGEKKYADYLENAYLNHILASQNPDTGMTTYFQSMATGYFKVFSSPWDDFWCCTGSGMENFTKLGESLIFGDRNELTVVTYLPCTLKSDGVAAELSGDIAVDGKVTLKLTEGKGVKLKLRVPDWAAGEITVTLNGAFAKSSTVNGFILLDDALNADDCVEISIPSALKAVGLCDNHDIVAIKYGPWLLAAKLGDEDMNITRTGVHVAIPEKSVSDGILHVGASAEDVRRAPEKYAKKLGDVEFELGGLTFVPYYLIKERYGIYWVVE